MISRFYDPILAFDDAGLLLLSELCSEERPRCPCHKEGRVDARCARDGTCHRTMNQGDEDEGKP